MKINKSLLLILMLALLIRLPAINNVLYVDEGHYANIKAYFSSQYYVENSLKPMDKEKAESYFAEKFNTIDSIAPHPPRGRALFTASAALPGNHTSPFRITPSSAADAVNSAMP